MPISIDPTQFQVQAFNKKGVLGLKAVQIVPSPITEPPSLILRDGAHSWKEVSDCAMWEAFPNLVNTLALKKDPIEVKVV